MDPAAWQSSQAPASKGGGSTRGAGVTWVVSNSVSSCVEPVQIHFLQSSCHNSSEQANPSTSLSGSRYQLGGALEWGAGCPAVVPGSREGGRAAAQAEQQHWDMEEWIKCSH